MKQILATQRLIPFIQYKFALNYKTWLVQLGAFLGIFTIITGLILMNAKNGADYAELYIAFYFITLFACGMYITSRSFHELSGTSKGFLFMQLPVSTFEKFSLPTLGSGILFPLLFTAFYVLVAQLSNSLWSNIYGFEYYAYPLFSKYHIVALKIYLILQPLYLLGSIQFKKQHLLWSTIGIITLFAALTILWIPVARLAFGEMTFDNTFMGTGIHINNEGFTVKDIPLLLTTITLWTIGYFKLKEREI